MTLHARVLLPYGLVAEIEVADSGPWTVRPVDGSASAAFDLLQLCDVCHDTDEGAGPEGPTMTADEVRRRAALFAAAARKYAFRDPTVTEDAPTYVTALIAHVQKHDYAAAHELRVGRTQAEWTTDDVAGFDRFLRRQRVTDPEAFSPGLHAFAIAESGPYPVTEAELLDVATRGLAALVEMRTQTPTRSLPIFANVLLTDGRLLSTTVGTDDRIAVLKLLAQRYPVFGYVLAFDAFIHGVNTKDSTATKRDAITVHVGTRELRRVKVRSYALDGGAVVWDPPKPDLDFRDASVRAEDPYAGIFAVPLSSGAPS